MEYYSEDKKKRWDGAIVCKWDWEPRHPQDLIKAVKEDTSIPDPRPEPPDIFVDGAQDVTFGLIDEFNNQIVTENEEAIQVPPANMA